MSKSVNQVTLMGRLTRDPEARSVTNGKNICELTLAVNRQGKDEQADFFDVTAWDKLSDLIMQYLKKGRRVLVQGRLRQDTWKDKDTGKNRSRVSVVATDVVFLDSSSDKKLDSADKVDKDFAPVDLSEIPF